MVVPHVPADVRSDPAGRGAKYRVPLLNQLFVLSPTPERARERTVRNALRYLEMASEGLLDVVRRDLTELETWRQLVEHGRLQFEQRYQTEYLAVETFHRFDRTREQVLAMLDLPGPGKVVTAVLALLRTPWKFARDFLVKTLVRPDVPHQSEAEVCADALAGWLNGLQAEALQRSGTHPVWKHVVRRFETTLKSQARGRFDAEYRRFELKETDELDQAVRAVPGKLAASPGLLNALRGTVVAADLAAAGAAVYFLWPPGWGLLLAIPLAVSASHQLVELAVARVVDAGRHRIKDHREDLLREHLSRPLATWLIDQPTAEGSSMERLAQVLDRVPRSIRAVVDRLAAAPAATADAGDPAR